MNQSNYHADVQSSVEHCLRQAEHHLKKSFVYHDLCFLLKGQAAGQFVVTQNAFKTYRYKLRFNQALLNQNQQAFIEEVVPHECAHLIVYQYFGRYHEGKKVMPHGRQWKQVMSEVFNVEPKVRHNFSSAKRARRTFAYICACHDRIHDLSAIRHNRIVRSDARYVCKSCKESLRIK